MTGPTLTISVSRTIAAGGPDPLLFSGTDDGTALGIVGYQAPSLVGRVGYAPDSAHVHGSAAIAAAWEQAVLGWDWIADNAATESDVQAAYAEVAAALGQFTSVITTQVSGAPAQMWRADMGSMVPSARSYVDLTHRTPVFAVTVPVYPIAGV